MPVPDRSLERRLAELERRVQLAEFSLARWPLEARTVTPLNARLWRFTLNADVSSGSAGADLLTLAGDDTGLDITVLDPLSIYDNMASGDAGFCIEQLDLNGTRKFEIVASAQSTQALKPFCRFTAGSAFTTSSQTVSGTIQTAFGVGQAHASSSATFYNLLSHTAGSYCYEGDSGDAGWAIWTGSGTDWNIIDMECP